MVRKSQLTLPLDRSVPLMVVGDGNPPDRGVEQRHLAHGVQRVFRAGRRQSTAKFRLDCRAEVLPVQRHRVHKVHVTDRRRVNDDNNPLEMADTERRMLEIYADVCSTSGS